MFENANSKRIHDELTEYIKSRNKSTQKKNEKQPKKKTPNKIEEPLKRYRINSCFGC